MKIWRRITGNSESGIVLIVCLALLLMLSLIGIASIMTSNTEMDISGNAQYQTAAFYLADAGAEKAVAVLQDSSDWRYGFYNQPLGDGIYNVMVFDSLSLPYLGKNLLVRSTGTVEGAESTIEVILAPRYRTRFEYAAYGRDFFDMNGGGMIDSYDSDSGSYASQATNGPDNKGYMFGNNNGNISSGGMITLGGNAQVHGDAETTPAGGFSLGGDVTVYGDTLRNPNSPELDSIPSSDIAFAQANNDAATNITLAGGAGYDPFTSTLTVPSGASAVFSSGTYYFSSTDVNGLIEIAPGAEVFIYITGTWDSSSGSLVNTDGIPANLRIYSTASDMKISGGSQVCAAVYAPNASVTVTGGSGFFGSVVARSFNNGGGTNFHFDEALLRLTDEDFIAGYSKIGWTEL